MSCLIVIPLFYIWIVVVIRSNTLNSCFVLAKMFSICLFYCTEASWDSFVLFTTKDFSVLVIPLSLCLWHCGLFVFYSAIFCWCQSHHPESPVLATIKDLLQRVSQYEDTIMDGIRNALENPPPSVSSVSESIDDLDVNQSNSQCSGGECHEKSCCKGEEKMDQDCPKQQQSNSAECLDDLLQSVKYLVSELGLPDELLGHIQDVKNTEEQNW